MYALNLAEDGRILSATYPQYAPADAVIVDSLPEGNIADYLCVNGVYTYDPVPEEPEEPAGDSLEDRVNTLESALDMILSGVTE